MDHIIPISLCDDDTAGNKRAAHLTCNVVRGNKMASEDRDFVMPDLVPSVLPRRLRAVKLCAECGAVKVQKAGGTCACCRAEARDLRRRLALEYRSQGMRWDDIAVELGLSGSGAAYNIAYPPGSPRAVTLPDPPKPPVVVVAQSDPPVTRSFAERRVAGDPLWWTTVRPN